MKLKLNMKLIEKAIFILIALTVVLISIQIMVKKKKVINWKVLSKSNKYKFVKYGC